MAKDKKKDQKKQEDEALLEMLKRAQADFVNYKARVERERAEMNDFAKIETIKQLLPVYESLDRALDHTTPEMEANDWVCGIKNIKKQFEDKLVDLGIVRMETVGHQFDPHLHEALMSEKVEGKKENEIIEEYEPGYVYKEKVLKHAKVKIAI